MPVDLEIQRVSQSKNIPDDEQFQHWAEAVLAGRDNEFTLAIRIVDKEEAQRFNRDYRNKDYASNVLSFPSELPEGLPASIKQSQLGDLLICAPLVASEAKEQHRTEAGHWAHLVVHGILHLLGYDHEQTDTAQVMETLEVKILAKFGVSDPYQDIA